MPSEYPVLGNRPIDQWKVTELKEELKRRKLPLKGLKEDLIKRLDEAIRDEREAAAAVGEIEHGINEPESLVVGEVAKTERNAVGEETVEGDNADISKVETVESDNDRISKVEAVTVQVDVNGSTHQPNQEVPEQNESELVGGQPTGTEISSKTDAPSAGLGDQVPGTFSSETAMGGQGLHDEKPVRDNEESMARHDSEDIKPPREDVKQDPINQVSEVNANLGLPLKSNSVSTDSVSVCEKNELEDNIIADDVKLEHDVKPEMVQPSSTNLVPDGGTSHPKDVEEPLENEPSVGETENTVTNADMSQKNVTVSLDSSEKLNLDKSSGDDFMEEDALESKQIDSNDNSGEVGVRNEKSEITILKEEAPITAMDSDLPAEEKTIHSENKDGVAASSDKRKLPDQEAILNNEPPKRQRRWKSEGTNTREPQISNSPPIAPAKDAPQPAAFRRNFSRSDSGGALKTPKEREVPPSVKAATTSLRIDNFLRPFTLKAVQELLAKTGTVKSFWMDHIKTHCYVTYSSVEEAVATRNAIYNLQWPPNGGRNLVAEFVDSQEVKVRVDPPPQPPKAPVIAVPAMAPEPPAKLPQPSPQQQDLRQALSRQTNVPPPSLSKPAPAKEQTHLPPPPPDDKVEAPILTLDDLFRKTKTTPRIYYLPLSEEQVSAKVEARKNSREQ